MTITRKSYSAIAEILATQRDGAGHESLIVLDVVTQGIADLIEADDARFDRSRFLKAAGAA